jgi:transposase
MIISTEKVISHKVGLLNLAEELQNVSQACKIMGFSRDTFYRYKEAVDDGGVEALFEKSRRKPNLRKRVDPLIEDAVLKYAVEDPAHGQTRTSNELRKRGIFVSPTGVRSIWLRHDLACFKDRLSAREKHVAGIWVVFTESLLKAIRRTSALACFIWLCFRLVLCRICCCFWPSPAYG